MDVLQSQVRDLQAQFQDQKARESQTQKEMEHIKFTSEHNKEAAEKQISELKQKLRDLNDTNISLNGAVSRLKTDLEEANERVSIAEGEAMDLYNEKELENARKRNSGVDKDSTKQTDDSRRSNGTPNRTQMFKMSTLSEDENQEEVQIDFTGMQTTSPDRSKDLGSTQVSSAVIGVDESYLKSLSRPPAINKAAWDEMLRKSRQEENGGDDGEETLDAPTGAGAYDETLANLVKAAKLLSEGHKNRKEVDHINFKPVYNIGEFRRWSTNFLKKISTDRKRHSGGH